MLTGTGVALITPFTSAGEVDYASLERTVNNLINGRVDFLVVLGTTGESATLTDEEKQQIVQCVAVATRGRVPLVLGAGGNDTAALVRSLQTIDTSAFSALLSVAPYYNRPSQQGLYAHFAALAQASPLPILLYNIPSRTGVNLEAETTLRLARDFGNIVGIKESSGSMSQLMQLLAHRPDDFSVLCGDDALGVPAVLMGAQGLISVMANIFPKDTAEMIRLALKGRTHRALELHYRYLDFMALLCKEGNPIGIKTAMGLAALCDETVRLPLVRGSESLRSEMAAFLKR